VVQALCLLMEGCVVHDPLFLAHIKNEQTRDDSIDFCDP
jgi:hypothetical protein